MAYLIGLVSREEQVELSARGWEFENPPMELIPPKKEVPANMELKMVFVDATMFDIMNGPDWEK